MSAPSLYRRHRPRTFDDVVGQDHVVRTLRNAVEQGKVHHAYLFVGSRGTGKTSLSKILAACLDCEHGPTTTPCGQCESCLSIQRATSLDVVEMDAASNNSVDDVRELRERVATTPTGGRWRVYILDEAHMLTNQAWNALLKTLEEPPPQTVFVLATTEAHKVPATVVDRCHRFDFTRPTAAQISRVLARVAEREQLTMSDGAVALVARNANGSFRDALGTLEQLVTYAGTTVTEEDAVTVLGIGDDAQVFAAVDAVIAGSAPDALRVVQDVASHGRDLGSYARELERHARDLLVCCVLGGVPPEVQLTADRDALLDAQARRIGRDQATRLLELLAEALTAARDGADQRAMLELALVKAADPNVDPALRALQVRLSRLEEAAGGGAPVVDAGDAFAPPVPRASEAPEPPAPVEPFVPPTLREVPQPPAQPGPRRQPLPRRWPRLRPSPRRPPRPWLRPRRSRCPRLHLRPSQRLHPPRWLRPRPHRRRPRRQPPARSRSTRSSRCGAACLRTSPAAITCAPSPSSRRVPSTSRTASSPSPSRLTPPSTAAPPTARSAASRSAKRCVRSPVLRPPCALSCATRSRQRPQPSPSPCRHRPCPSTLRPHRSRRR